MDQNNGLEARISKEETRTFLTIDLGEVPLLFTRISLHYRTSHMGKTIPTREDYLMNAQINHSIGTMETDLEMDLSTIRMGTGETMATFLVLHRLKRETSPKMISVANQVLSLPTLLSADLIIDLRLVLQKFPQNNDQTSSNVVRFTTTVETINELSDIYPLKY